MFLVDALPAAVRPFYCFPAGEGGWGLPSDPVQYAILGLLSASADGAHGYQLKPQLDALYGEFWTINYSQLYRTLDRLERAGLVECTEHVQGRRPNRKVYRVTASGRRSFDDWLILPPSDEPRPLRDELSVKLLFLTEPRRKETLALIRSQRAIYLQHLARLTKRRSFLDGSGDEMSVTGLLLLQADMRVRTDLAWLELVEQELLQRPEIKPGARPRPVLSKTR